MGLLRINEDDLELTGFDGGGQPIFHYNGKPFTGILVMYEDDGTLSYEQEHQDGYNEGLFRPYHKNGQIYEEYQAHNNVEVDGTYKRWDENGNLLETY